MPSSISSSEPARATKSGVRPVLAALGALILLAVVLETATRFGFQRVSRIESRTNLEYREAVALRHEPGGRSTVLLLGNSLLLEGVDVDRLREHVAGKVGIRRFVIEQTGWTDWYYGIRRLLADGSRPDRIVLCLSIPQILSKTLRGEYSAYYLIRTSDVRDAGLASGYDATRIFNLYVARYSLFYAGSVNLRNFLLNKADSRYADALREIGRQPLPPFADAYVSETAARHLSAVSGVCAQYRVRCDFLIPPGFPPPESEPLLEGARRAGVPVLMPAPLGTWSKDLFVDGFHLNGQGRARFTALLAPILMSPVQLADGKTSQM